MNDIEKALQSESSRRTFITRVGVAGVGAGAMALLAGCGSGSGTSPAPGNVILPNVPNGPTPTPSATTSPTPTPNTPITDADILNFALNLEYLEAEYYLRGTTGNGLSSTDSGGSTATVVGGRAVSFSTPAYQQYAQEVAADELAHVRFLRAALSQTPVGPVIRPALNFTDTFNTLAQLAGLGSTFDPFANENTFLLGAFVFEDVGVTAYKGAARLISNKDYLEAAAGILAVEAYHSGLARTLIFETGSTAISAANAISGVRGQLGGGKDQGVTVGGVENIVPTDANSIAYSRSTSEVLRIVYGNSSATAASGGFFPAGVNGRIKAATA